MRRILITLMCIGIASPYATAEVTNNGCETAINCTVSTTNSPTGVLNNRPRSGTTTTTTTTSPTTNTTPVVGNTGTGAYTQAAAAKEKADDTASKAMMMAMMFMPICMNPQTAMIGCPLMLAALAAMAMAKKKSGQAQDLMNALGTGGGNTSTIGTNNGDSSSSTTTTTDTPGTTTNADMERMVAAAKKSGYKLDGEGNIVTPAGKKIDASLSPESLAAAGVSSADAGKIQTAMAKAQKEADSAAASGIGGLGDSSQFAGGSGGGGPDSGGGRGTASVSESSSSSLDGDAASSDLAKDPSKWGGYFKQYGDSSIGVANSDIFMMVEKRVELERKPMGQ